jgi:hypothetical protein
MAASLKNRSTKKSALQNHAKAKHKAKKDSVQTKT